MELINNNNNNNVCGNFAQKQDQPTSKNKIGIFAVGV
jgi:hypothetical protein